MGNHYLPQGQRRQNSVTWTPKVGILWEQGVVGSVMGRYVPKAQWSRVLGAKPEVSGAQLSNEGSPTWTKGRCLGYYGKPPECLPKAEAVLEISVSYCSFQSGRHWAVEACLSTRSSVHTGVLCLRRAECAHGCDQGLPMSTNLAGAGNA